MTQSTYKIDFILVEISGSVLGKKCSTKWWKTSCRSTKCISRSDQHLLGMRKQLSPDASTWYKLGIVDLNPVLLEAQWIRISYSSCFSHQERNFPASSTFNLYSRPLFLQTYLQLHLVLWFYVNIYTFVPHTPLCFFFSTVTVVLETMSVYWLHQLSLSEFITNYRPCHLPPSLTYMHIYIQT